MSVGHDVLICLGALSLTNREFSLSVLAALLTVIGFAVNDRIVMYDRLREIRAKKLAKGVTFAEQVNLAVNQTLSRTVLTVATVVLSAAMLFLFGGATLENFALVVLVGAITAPLSTVYVPAALDVDWTTWIARRRAGTRRSAGPWSASGAALRHTILQCVARPRHRTARHWNVEEVTIVATHSKTRRAVQRLRRLARRLRAAKLKKTRASGTDDPLRGKARQGRRSSTGRAPSSGEVAGGLRGVAGDPRWRVTRSGPSVHRTS